MFLPALAMAAAAPFCGDALFAVYCLFTLVMFSAMLLYHRETSFKEVAVLYSMVVMIPSALNTLVLLRGHGPGPRHVPGAGGGDVRLGGGRGGLLCRHLFRQAQALPRDQPQKDRRGGRGRPGAQRGGHAPVGLLFSQWFYGGAVQANYLFLFLAGFLGTFVSILGDLSFSLIKRSCHIKDFGQVIPGHGGILDRFDSVIFTAPFLYLLATYLPPVF